MTVTIHPPRLHAGQLEVWHSPARFRVITKGRRWGGTKLGCATLFVNSLRGQKLWWVSPSFSSPSHSNAWRTLVAYFKQVPGWDERRHLNKSTWTIQAARGGFIQLKSAEKGVSLRGEGLHGLWVDESAWIDDLYERWNEDLRPSLTERRGWAVFNSSPNGFNYHHTLHARGEDPKYPGWAAWQFPSWSNPLLPPDEIASAKHECSKSTFDQEWGAQFVSMEGMVYPDFSRTANVTEAADFDDKLDATLGVDFGFRSFAIEYRQHRGREVRNVWDAKYHDVTTDRAAMRFLADVPEAWVDKITTIACDPAGDAANLQTGLEDVRVFGEHFPRARIVYSTQPDHRNPEWRSARIRDSILSADGTIRKFVHPRATNSIAYLEGSVYPKHRPGKPEKREPVKDGILDHNRDADGYAEVNSFHLGQVRML